MLLYLLASPNDRRLSWLSGPHAALGRDEPVAGPATRMRGEVGGRKGQFVVNLSIATLPDHRTVDPGESVRAEPTWRDAHR